MKTYWKTASHKFGFDKTRTLTYGLKVNHLDFHVQRSWPLDHPLILSAMEHFTVLSIQIMVTVDFGAGTERVI